MDKLQNITVALALTLMCFSGCLENDDDSKSNLAPEALIVMPRQASKFVILGY